MKPEATGASGPFLISHPDGWAEVILDDPTRPVNVLTVAVMEGLEALVASFHSRSGNGALAGVVFRSGKARSFLAGADLDAMDGIRTPAEAEAVARRGQALFQSMADLAVPTVAVIHGPCVGGGTELALACDLRILSDDPGTALSLPEVRLGIVPAWGGTTRLPPRVGLLPALPMLLTGRAVRAREALRMGLADAVHPAAELATDAMAPARALAAAAELRRRPRGGGPARGGLGRGGLGRGGLARWVHRIPGAQRLILWQARRSVLRETGGAAPAPLAILDLLSKTGGRGDPATMARGLALEARALGALLVSPESLGLRHLFRLQQAARRPLDGGDAMPTDALPGLFLEAPAAGAAPTSPSGAALFRAAGRRGVRVQTGPLHLVDHLPGGPTQWILACPPEDGTATAARLPPRWRSRLVGLGRPEGVGRGPLMELVAPAPGAGSEDAGAGDPPASPPLTLLREAHALALALGGIPILVQGPEGRIGGMVRALRGHRARDPEVSACHQLTVALAALDSGAFRGAGSVDLAMVLAEVAPPWRGGPLHEAGEVGLRTTRMRMERAMVQRGEPFEPPALLERLIASGTALDALDGWGTWHPYGSGTPS